MVRLPTPCRFLVLASLAAAPGLAAGDNAYPTRPIRLILPGPPGGGADTLVRMLGQVLGPRLGQTLVVDNRPGAGGLIGMDIAAKATPDGYSVVMGNSGPNAVIPNLRKKIPYDPVKDLAPISLVAATTNVLIVHPSVPSTSLEAFIAFAKSRKGETTFASGGNGQSSHLAGELFKLMTGVPMVHVPYKGTGPALTDLIGGRVTFMFTNLPSAGPHVSAGRVKAVAVTSRTRSRLMPDLPTVAESGLPDYEASQWYGMLAPAGTPGAVIARLNREIVAAVNAPELRATMEKRGFDVVGSSAEAFAQHIAAELAKWKKVIEGAKIAGG